MFPDILVFDPNWMNTCLKQLAQSLLLMLWTSYQIAVLPQSNSSFYYVANLFYKVTTLSVLAVNPLRGVLKTLEMLQHYNKLSFLTFLEKEWILVITKKMTFLFYVTRYLYDLLTKGSVVRKKIPLLILCNKTDKVTAHTKEFICRQLEKEMYGFKSLILFTFTYFIIQQLLQRCPYLYAHPYAVDWFIILKICIIFSFN